VAIIIDFLHRKNDVIEWSSKKASAKTANRLLAREIERMARKGYDLKCSNIIQEGRSKRSWLLLGIFNFVRGKQVQATAVFVKRPDGVTLT
jgi:hypothetical protein